MPSMIATRTWFFDASAIASWNAMSISASVRQGIPSVMVDIGNEKGSREGAIEKKWLTDRYHAPSDDVNQPVDKQAAATFNLLVETLIERIANAQASPAWKPNSFFRRYASN